LVFENTTRWVPSLNGGTINTSGGDSTGGASFSAGTTNVGRMRLTAIVTAVSGTSGTFQFFEEGGVGVDAVRSTGSNGNFLYFSSQNTGQAFNTSVANTIGIAVNWPGTSSTSQNCIGNISTFTRMGP
jgi:hypothetical protein